MTDPIDKPYFPANEPGAQQEGVDAPGFFSSTSDFMNGGIYNGTFRLGPPQSASNIDVATSLVGSNFVPGWRFVQASNTAIDGLHLRNTAAPGGSNFRFVYKSGAAADESFIEQLVDITGTAVKSRDAYRATVLATGADFRATVAVQYLTVDGIVTGGETILNGDLTAGTQKSIVLAQLEPPTNSKYARVRVRATRGLAATSATGSVDILEVKRDRPATQASFSDVSDPDTNGAGTIYQYDADLVLRPAAGGGVVSVPTSYPAATTHAGTRSGDISSPSGQWINIHGYYDNGQAEKYSYTSSSGGSNLLLGWQIVTVPFTDLNLAAGASSRINFSVNSANINYLPTPYPAHVVGLSLRLAGGVQTAGTIQVDVATGTGASSLITNAYTFTATNSRTFEARYALGTYQYAAGEMIGMRTTCSSSPALAPTGTLDIGALLFLAIPWDAGLL